MQDHYKHIAVFVQTARSGSFTAAAEQQNITPAAISKSIGILEKFLGVRLFNRTTRSLSLTAEGKEFLQQVQPALAMLEVAADTLKIAQSSPVGRVRISLPAAIGRHLVLPLLPELQSRYPQLQLELDFNDRVIDFVKDGYDLVIRGGVIEDSSLIQRPLMTMTTSLVAAPAYLARAGEPQSVADLHHHRLIARRFLSGKYQLWHFQDNQVIKPYQAAITCFDSEAVTNAALLGLGIAEVPDYLAKPYFADGRLQKLLPQLYRRNEFPLVLQYPHRTQLAPRVKAVADFFVEKAKRW
ncbi:DNA-binding transcriptional LysR family regulator [Cricetibacter osteomyelitidis]|uniref:DNA-binding transcriptional LysR family regulator n=1 Tax=Cricetibacter osteomyelitidis TaxID=1521931 RepID=A0A4R2T526_9PAST|nr:LysR family transcriptional regulator [Cricetibacter osteomyelitidis]TCP92178.1 DNA-binding transcriptional LysR family regulator [Cricetibacter osteomyelitidis]